MYATRHYLVVNHQVVKLDYIHAAGAVAACRREPVSRKRQPLLGGEAMVDHRADRHHSVHAGAGQASAIWAEGDPEVAGSGAREQFTPE